MSPDQKEQLVRLVIAVAILAVAAGGYVALFQLDGC